MYLGLLMSNIGAFCPAAPVFLCFSFFFPRLPFFAVSLLPFRLSLFWFLSLSPSPFQFHLFGNYPVQFHESDNYSGHFHELDNYSGHFHKLDNYSGHFHKLDNYSSHFHDFLVLAALVVRSCYQFSVPWLYKSSILFGLWLSAFCSTPPLLLVLRFLGQSAVGVLYLLPHNAS